MLTLNKLITANRVAEVVSKEDLSLAKENDRLWRLGLPQHRVYRDA